MTGPLTGIRVIELAGIGPAPFAAMLLADLGAEVIQIERVAGLDAKLAGGPISDLVNRRRRSIRIDLKSQRGREIVLDLIADADVFIEGFRPGTAERLGLGPTEALARNPNLIYGRMTGWGQEGPLALRAGHDLNYLAITGALHAMGHADQPPPPPLNLVADYGGGAMFLAVGVLAALFAVQHGTGGGQVIDAAMVDGVVALTTLFHSLVGSGAWTDQRQANLLDGGLPCYATYECRGGGYLSIAALEPQFYSTLVELTGFADGRPEFTVAAQYDRVSWPAQRARWAELFRTRTREEWTELLTDSDACAAPVLTFDEAPTHPHLVARQAFVDVDGVPVPAPAPRFSATSLAAPTRVPEPGAATAEVLLELGYVKDQIEILRANGVIA